MAVTPGLSSYPSGPQNADISCANSADISCVNDRTKSVAGFVSGHGFSRAVSLAKSIPPLGAEGFVAVATQTRKA